VACRQRARPPGWVLKAIVQVLTDRGEPMRAKDIHARSGPDGGAGVLGLSQECAGRERLGLLTAIGPSGKGTLRAGREHGVRVSRYLGDVKHSALSTTPTAERPALSQEERTERLRSLSERLRSSAGLDRDTLARIEQLTDTER
jgi:hypothetical protein